MPSTPPRQPVPTVLIADLRPVFKTFDPHSVCRILFLPYSKPCCCILLLDSFTGFARWSRQILYCISWLDLRAGFARFSRWICSLDLLDSLAGFAEFARGTLAGFTRGSRWIPSRLSLGSLDAPASFARWLRWILSLDSLVGLSLPLLTGYTRWMLSIYWLVYRLRIGT
jgi:hypothetical protein